MRIHRIQIGGFGIDFFYFNIVPDLILIAIPLAFISFIEKKKITPEKVGLKSNGAVKDAVLSAKLFFALMIVSFLISIFTSLFGLNDFEPVGEQVKILFASNAITLVYFFIFRVFVEEFFFRAFLVPRIGVIGASIIFGSAHIGYGSIGEIIGATILGGILALGYKRSGSIIPSFVAHLCYNLIAAAFLIQAV